jgi:hypothetical protein
MNRIIGAALLLTVALLFLARQHSASSPEFEAWKLKFAATFDSPADEFYRRVIFEANFARIRAHNADPSQTYTMGVNQFTIYTTQEFQERFLNSKLGAFADTVAIADGQAEAVGAVLVDWEAAGAVGPVNNQGSMSSPALFATLEVVASLSKLATGTLQQFSR